MAHFYGTVRGGRKEASRLGTRNSGLATKAASWQGAVAVELYAHDGVDMARVRLTTHEGAGVERVLYDGPVSGAKVRKPRKATRADSLAARAAYDAESV